MTPDQATQVVQIFVAAYPGSPADEHTVRLFTAALQPVDFDIARDAAIEHVRSSSWWPTVADLNRLITTRLRDAARRAEPAAIAGRMRCTGSGWLDRGDGLEPCPACNPWLRTQFEEGDLHSDRRPLAPKDYVMPAPCRPVPEGPTVPGASGWRIAAAAYAQACAEEGRPPTPKVVASLESGRYLDGAA